MFDDTALKTLTPLKLLIIGQLPPPIHGSNIMTQIFVRSLKNIGHKIFLVQKTFASRQDEIGKFSFFKVLKIPVIWFKIGKAVISFRPTLCFYFISVKFPTFFIDAFFLFFMKLLKVKYVLYVHGLFLLNIGSSSSKINNFVVKKTLSGAFGALILGENLRKDINQFIPDNRLFILPNAIEDFESGNVTLDKGASGNITVLYLSNLRRSKGTMEFLHMAKMVTTKSKNVKFVLAGPARSISFEKEINSFITNEGLYKYIDIPGGVYGAQKEKLFCCSDIFIFPTHDEAFGLVNLEALKWGLPVIATNVGAIPEIIQHGINGFIVPPKDTKQLTDYLMLLIEDSELRTRMGKAGREIYEKT
jgi:glycosyltransferase involved in cell wall biosynthesis